MKLRLPLAAAAVAAASLFAPAALPAGAASCAVTWGSLDKTDPDMSGAHLVNIRAGQHECYDRLVFDFDGTPIPGYNAEYVSQVTHIASGDPIPLRGGAFLEIVVRAPAFDLAGNPTYPRAGKRELVNVSGFQTFRQASWAGSQEGLTEIGLGVRARLPFRVFVLSGPGGGSRVVVDVAHHW